MEELGRRLIAGAGVPRDQPTGVAWFQRAADAGSPTAAFNVGVMYDRGFVLERNAEKAVEWYRKAVAGGVAPAKHNLALMLREGRGAPQDGPKAVELLREAARQGMTASMYALGDMYEHGGAVLKDPAAALAWFAITTELELQANHGTDTALVQGGAAARRGPAARDDGRRPRARRHYRRDRVQADRCRPATQARAPCSCCAASFNTDGTADKYGSPSHLGPALQPSRSSWCSRR